MANASAQKLADKHNEGVRAAQADEQDRWETPKPGHNSAPTAKQLIQSYVERVERLESEKKAIADDIRDVYGEAKGTGLDVQALRAMVKERKEDPKQRQERELILDTYRLALGMVL